MPTLKIIRTKPNHDVEYFNQADGTFQILAMRHPYEWSNYLMGDAGLARASLFTFTTRDRLNAYLNDPDRFLKRDEANAYDAEHGITTRLAVLDGENSGRVKFNSVTNLYDVISMSEEEADAWVTELAVVPGPSTE